MPSQTAPDCFDVLSVENFIELKDELCKRGVTEFFPQRHQERLAAAYITGNSTMVAAQGYAKSIIEKLAKDSAQDERLVKDFVSMKYAVIMQLRVLYNWTARMIGILQGDSTLETHKDIARVYHSKLVAYRSSKFIFDARGFICMKALVIVDDIINHLSSKEGVLEYIGVIYYLTGRGLVGYAYASSSRYPSLLANLCQRVDDRLTEAMNTNKCQLHDIIEWLDESLWRSIIQLQERSLLLGVQGFRTHYLEELEATWACNPHLRQEDINRFGALWEWMAGRKLQLILGLGETAYPFPEQDLSCHRDNLRHAMMSSGVNVEYRQNRR